MANAEIGSAVDEGEGMRGWSLNATNGLFRA